jgi:hypothetical protein
MSGAPPPSNSPSSHAIIGKFLLGMVFVHHLHQIFTSNSDVTLKHFCNSASHRSTFHKTLLQIVHGTKEKYVLPLQTIFPSVPSLGMDGIFRRRTDTRMKAVAWGTVSSVATPQWRVKEWCTKNSRNDAEEIVNSRMKSCTGVPLDMVDIKTKCNKGKLK